MSGRYAAAIGLLMGALAVPAFAAPSVVTLGVGEGASDPVAACEAQAASPDEAGRRASGLSDKQIFLDGALAACEAALAAAPESVEVEAWLARVYTLIGRATDAVALLQKAADGGSAFASYQLAGLYSNGEGDGVSDDAGTALRLLQQAADGGFVPAVVKLAERTETGDGVAADTAEALRLYQIAADAGDGHALYQVGYFHQYGLTAEADYDAAMRAFRASADAGSGEGWYGVGQLYQFGQGVETDPAQAAEAYQHGADLGEPMSETALAYLYEQGIGVTQDYSRSLALLTDAAGQGYGFGIAALSLHYLFGEGTEADPAKAFDLAWTAANKHVVYAEGILGYMYAEGLGTDRDLSAALMHFQTGSEGGDHYSTDRLAVTQTEIDCAERAGSPYEPGGAGVAFDAIEADAAISACEAALAANTASVGDKVWLGRAYARAERFDEALPLLKEGADAGNVLGLTTYADLLAQGQGGETDAAGAVALYQAAAARGFAPAQYALGLAYADGTGIAADPDQARQWLGKALDAGIEEAQQQIDRLGSSPDGEQSTELTGFGREGLAY